MSKGRVDWETCKEFVQGKLALIEDALKTWGKKHTKWRFWTCFENYPPRIWLIFEHGPVGDGRRAEVYGNEIKLAYPTDEEIEPVADFVGSLVEKHNLRARRDWAPGGSGTSTLSYTLKPHYKNFEID